MQYRNFYHKLGVPTSAHRNFSVSHHKISYHNKKYRATENRIQLSDQTYINKLMPGDYPGDRFEIKITGKEKEKIIRKGYEESKKIWKR